MSLEPALKAKIEALIASDKVVLFMKGTAQQPRCGFSAAVVDILDGIVDGYATVDVLADADVREGIKVFSEWPTIPQLYVNGEFVGGADITKDLFASGELHKMLGVTPAPAPTVTVTVTPAAAQALSAARAAEAPDHRFLRLTVSARFAHGLSFGPALAGDVATSSNGVDIRVDAASARRANGVVIDFVERPQAGFRITNPNEPPRVRGVSVVELKSRLEAARAAGAPLALFDVRTPGEWQTAKIDGAVLVDDAVRAQIEALPKSTPLYFHCHHGGRSQAAAEHYLGRGFVEVYNVEGGIDAWSQLVDKSVPRY